LEVPDFFKHPRPAKFSIRILEAELIASVFLQELDGEPAGFPQIWYRSKTGEYKRTFWEIMSIIQIGQGLVLKACPEGLHPCPSRRIFDKKGGGATPTLTENITFLRK